MRYDTYDTFITVYLKVSSDRPNMTIAVDWDIKHQVQQTKHESASWVKPLDKCEYFCLISKPKHMLFVLKTVVKNDR